MATTSNNGHSSSFEEKLNRRAQMNYESILAFLVTLTLVTVLFTVPHILRWSNNSNPTNRYVKEPTPYTVATFRKIKSILLHKAPGLPSVGHAALISVYAVINFVITFTNMDNSMMSVATNIASRSGWMAVVNMVLVVLLAMKNNLLGRITAVSYERLNILHQVSGYTTLAFAIIHGSCYSWYFSQRGDSEKLTTFAEIFGILAGLSFLMLVVSGTIVRRWWYELFYYLHILFWLVGIVALGLHQPEIGKKVLIGTCIGAGLWVLDRLIRMARLALYGTNNTAKLTPLPNGGTRLTFKKYPLGAVPGEHCLLWIPKMRLFETHPFTMISTDPAEFVVASHDGFTRDLHRFAVKNPGAVLRGSSEGAYGVVPDPSRHDTVVLVAGGSGASFTFSATMGMLRNTKLDESKRIIFIWTVRNYGYLEWFSAHLNALQNDKRVEIQVYVTRSADSEIARHSRHDLSGPQERHQLKEESDMTDVSVDPEKCSATEADFVSRSARAEHVANTEASFFKYGRPCVSELIGTVISEMPADHRALVMGCGPSGMMDDVRKATASNICAEGPEVELHCEQFGW